MASQNTPTSSIIHISNVVYIKPTYLILKPNFVGGNKRRSERQKANEQNLKENKQKGILSQKAKSNLRNSINWLLHAAKYKRVWSKKDNKAFWFKVNFVTLTIPPQSTGVVQSKEFQKCLNIWLTYARKYFYLKNYVWKIEAHADNRLHIHFTTDTFINHKFLKESWNRILQKQGLLEYHFEKYENYSPNSTDVHAVYKVEDVAAYLCTYMTKKTALAEDYKGRVWGCSYSLSCKKKVVVELDTFYNERDYSFLNNPALRWKELISKPDSMGGTKKVADMYFISQEQWLGGKQGTIRDAYINHIMSIRNGTPESPNSYRQIDFFSSKNVEKKEQYNQINPNFEICEIKAFTQKTGSIQLDLQF